MLIKYRNNGVEKHVSQEVGQGFIDAGLADEVVSDHEVQQRKLKEQKKGPNTTWRAVRGQISGDYEEQPFIYHYCSTCGQSGYFTGRSAHLTQVFRHCGVAEQPPRDVVERYVTLWNTREKRKRVGKPITLPSARVDQTLAAVRGVKTHEQLVVDLQAAIAMAAAKK